MSTTAQSPSPSGHGTADIVHAQQHMSWPWIIGVGVVSVLIFAVATLWSTHILNVTRSEMQPAGPPPIPKEVNQYEVGIVNLRVFALDQRAAQKRLRQNVFDFTRNDDELRKAVASRSYADGAYPFDVL